tara:strand:+ start:213 stop:677 length:465 start_codon:yes stop_codon:yes gene_type:complete
MIKINVITSYKSWHKYISDPSQLIRKKINLVNKKYNKYKNKNISFTLLLSDETHIKKLNKQFRNKNKSTDILSFPFHKRSDLKKKLKRDKEIYLGDIIVNLNQIKDKKNISNFILELNRLWVHGFTHLLGFDHKKDKDFEKMRRVENKFLSYIR